MLIELELVVNGASTNDPELMSQSVRRAIDGARLIGDALLQAAGATLLSTEQLFQGDIVAASATYDKAAGLLLLLDVSDVVDHLDVLHYLAITGWMMGRYGDAEAHVSQGIALSRASGRTHLLIEMMSARSFTLTSLGRPADALILAEDCLEAAEVAGSPAELVWAQMARCAAFTATGELANPVAAGEHAVAAARTVSLSVITSAAAWWCADALLELGEPERAIALLLDLLGGPELPRWYLAGSPLCYETLTRAELALGRRDEAEGWARRATAIAGRIDLPIIRAYADRCRAEVSLADGDPTAAASLAERAAGDAEICGAPIETARARLLAGRAHAAAGDRERAGRLLKSAEAGFAACGAQRWRAQAVRELRRIGRRVHRSAQRATPGGDGIAALSAREREVAELVSEHRTNCEIAGRLFLSEKTIESHLRNIFVKLGVGSRADVARALQRIT